MERRMSDTDRAAWRQVATRVIADLGRNKLSLLAAGTAFYGIFSIAPITAAAVSFYGLIYDPARVEEQIATLSVVMPKEALSIIDDELERIVSINHAQLGIGLLVSLAVGLGSAAAGTSALMAALNVAYGEEEKRGLVRYYTCCFLLTAALLLFGSFSLALLAAVPALVDFLPVGPLARLLVGWLRWPVLAVLACMAITVIYRYGPSRKAAHRRWLSWGAAAATLLWIGGSALFSVYLYLGVYIGKFPESYGALGAVVALMMWLWLSAFALLLGGALEAQTELLARDRT